MKTPKKFGVSLRFSDYEKILVDTKVYKGRRRPVMGSNHPLVSIVTAVLNNRDLLVQTLNSVRNQSYPNIEYIVVDGGSTDGTLSLLEGNTDVISLWISEPDAGLYDAINKGLTLASGMYLKIINSDDLLRPDAISCMVEAMGMRDNCCAYGPMQWMHFDGSPKYIRGQSDRAFWLPKNFPYIHPTWLVPRKIHAEHGLYQINFSIAADLEMYYRLTTSSVEFLYVDRVTVDFRLGGVSHNLAGIKETTRIHRHYSGWIRAEFIRIFSYILRWRNKIRKIFQN